MALIQANPSEQSQRIQVEMDASLDERSVKIRLERFDELLGWYTAGSLALPLHQLPLLEQAVAEMRSLQAGTQTDKIVLFPGVSAAE